MLAGIVKIVYNTLQNKVVAKTYLQITKLINCTMALLIIST